jgi:dihydroorotate dehydrogenase
MNKFLLKLNYLIPPEISHYLFIKILKYNLVKQKVDNKNLEVNLWGKSFKNPLGLAAGFDKNAEVINGCLDIGFGFVEVGTVTPKPQVGNAKPRVFRIPEYEAVIQRLGFNNKGIDFFIDNIVSFKKKSKNGIIGCNIGKNKDTKDYVSDYSYLLKKCEEFSDYIVVNVSSPNTPGLRDIQKKEMINFLLKELHSKKTKKVPLLIKISPDINYSDLENICDIAITEKWLNGIIVSNTTTTRESLKNKPMKSSWKITEDGGLSGPPIFDISNAILSKTYRLTKGKVPLIGVGGISTAEDAFEKIAFGANLIQIYTSLIYQGPWVVPRILKGLSRLLDINGFKNIKSAVGHKVK